MTFEINRPLAVTVAAVFIQYVTREEKATVRLKIEADTGRLLNYVDGFSGRFHEKVVDTGSYELLDEDDERVSFHRDYVPSWVPGEFGDYLNITVENGVVQNWATYFNRRNLEAYFA